MYDMNRRLKKVEKKLGPEKGAFGTIAQNIEKAVSTLVGLLDSKDEPVRRLTANDVIGHFLKHKELKDLEERIQRVEEQLEVRG